MILELQVEMWKRWFRVHETIVFTVGVGPQRLQKLSKLASKKCTEKVSNKTQKVPEIVPKGTPRGCQKAVNEPTFSSLFRHGALTGALGSPTVVKRLQQTPKGYQNDTKMHKNHTKHYKKAVKNEPQHNKTEKQHQTVSSKYHSVSQAKPKIIYKFNKKCTTKL